MKNLRVLKSGFDMKRISVLVLMVTLLIISTGHTKECFIVKEKDKLVKKEGECQTAFAPHSTFKIPLSLMGFDSGILMNENAPSFPFTDENTFLNICKSAHDPKTWMRDSCVWFSQVLTKKLGMKKFQEYVTKFEYGNRDVSGGLEKSWLSSSLKITADEQIQFIQKMIDYKLPINSKAVDKTKSILFIQELPGGWKLYGKTGNGSNHKRIQQGWFVGWIEKENRKLVFVQHIADEKVEKTYASFRSKNEATTKLWYLINDLAGHVP